MSQFGAYGRLGGGYMVRSTSSYIGRSKAEYLVEMQFNPLQQAHRSPRRRVAARRRPNHDPQ